MEIFKSIFFVLMMIIKCYILLTAAILSLALNILSTLFKCASYLFKGLTNLSLKLSTLTNVELDWGDVNLNNKNKIFLLFKRSKNNNEIKDIKPIYNFDTK